MNGSFDHTLAVTFGFDEADLIANRTLQLSLSQRGRMRDGADAHRRNVPRTIGIMAVALVVVAAFSVWQTKGDASQLTLALGATIPVVAFIVYLIRRNYAVADRLDAGDALVQMAEGTVTVDDPGFDWTARHQRRLLAIRIAGVEFLHEPEDAEAFENSGRYRVYWAEPWGKRDAHDPQR